MTKFFRVNTCPRESFTGKECCASRTFLYFTVHSRTFDVATVPADRTGARENGKTTSKSVWLTVTPRYAPSMRCFLPLPEWEISQRWYLTETSSPPSPSLLPVTSLPVLCTTIFLKVSKNFCLYLTCTYVPYLSAMAHDAEHPGRGGGKKILPSVYRYTVSTIGAFCDTLL